MASYSEKGHTLYDAEAQKEGERREKDKTFSQQDMETIWRMKKKKKELDEKVRQLYGDFAAVTSFLTLVLFLRRIILNVLCNAITKLQYDFHTLA